MKRRLVVARACDSGMAPGLKGIAHTIMLWALLAVAPAMLQAQDFAYTIADDTVTITAYVGAGGDVAIPGTIEDLPVVAIADGAFSSIESVTSVSIPESVASIGNGAFAYCVNLTNISVDALSTAYCSVDGVLFDASQSELVQYPGGRPGEYVIPDGVLTVRDAAFYGSAHITGIMIPSGITNIGNSVFADCPELVAVTIPNTVVNLADWAFASCVALPNAIIPESVTNLGFGAFAECTSLAAIYFKGNAPSVGPFVFNSVTGATVYYLPTTTGWGATLGGLPTAVWDLIPYTYSTNNGAITITGYSGAGGSVTIPETINGLPVTGIGSNAFNSVSSLTSVAIPDSVTNIGVNAFAGCANLTAISVNSSHAVYSSLDGVLYNKSRTELIQCPGGKAGTNTVPGSVTSIAPQAYLRCANLTAIDVDSSNTVYSSLDGVLLNKAQTTLIQCPAGRSGRYTVPDGVTGIGAGAFSGCASLAVVSVPATVASIGDMAFSDCTALADLYFRGNAPSLGTQVFTNSTSVTVHYLPGTTGWGSSYGGQPAVLLPFLYAVGGGTVTITNYAGSGGAVSIPGMIEGWPVTAVGDRAFMGDGAVTGITVPDSVSNIGYRAFAGCTGLTAISVGALNPAYSSVSGVLFNKSRTVLIQCPGAKAGSYTVPTGVTSIGSSAFTACASLVDVTVPGDVTVVGSNAFSYCTSLAALHFSGNAPSVGEGVFEGSSSVTIYYLPGATGWGSTLGGRPVVMWDPPQFNYTTNNGSIIITGYIGAGGAVTVPGTIQGLPVGGISSYAFQQGASITSLTISSGAAYIGDWAFLQCTNLATVTIAASVTNIGAGAFYQCGSLAGVYFLGDAPGIGQNVFVGDGNATVYYLPGTTGWGTTLGGRPTVLLPYTYTSDGVRITLTGYVGSAGTVHVPGYINGLPVGVIGSNVFSACTNLVTLVVPSSVTNIGASAFAACPSLTEVYFKGNAPAIGAGIFAGSDSAVVYYLPASTGWGTLLGGRPAVLLPYSYTIQGDTVAITAYLGSGGEVTIPASVEGSPVTGIGSGAFAAIGTLTGIQVPRSVTNIGFGAFSSCSNLSAITVDSLNPVYSSSSGVLFNKNQTALIQCPGGKTGSYTIPGGVASIGNNGFASCTRLSSVTIPTSVTTIGSGAFSNCTSLSRATIPSGVVSLPDHAFSRCGSLTNVTLSSGIITIGTGSFRYCTSLSVITIPSSVTSIGDSAFDGCAGLTGVYFRGNAPFTGTGLFAGADAVTAYYLPGTTGWESTLGGRPAVLLPYVYTVDNGAVIIAAYVGSGGAVTVPASIEGWPVTTLWEGAFAGLSNLTGVTIPSSVTNIAGAVFSDCSSLSAIAVDALNPAYSSSGGVLFNKNQSVLVQYPGGKAGGYTIPGGVAAILDRAFALCAGLSAVTIPASVTNIGNEAFAGCVGLTGVVIPQGVISIGNRAFASCTQLGSVSIPTSLATISDGTFSNCIALTRMTIPVGVTGIGDYALSGCSSLTNVTIPSSVGSLGMGALSFCSQLGLLIIPDSVTSIGDTAFSGCDVLASLYFKGDAPTVGSDLFPGSTNATVYYLPYTTGWDLTLGGRPAVLLPYVYAESNGSIRISAYAGSGGNVVIPERIEGLPVVGVGAGAFAAIGALTAVTVADTITNIGVGAFSNCPNLTTISVGDSNTAYSSAAGVLFNKVQSVLIQCPGAKTGSYAVPGSVAQISDHAFAFCGGLGSVSIPGSVTNIGVGAWLRCGSLAAIVVDPLNPSYSSVDGILLDKSGTTIIQCPGGKGGDYAISNGVARIGADAFAFCTNLTTTVVPASVTNLADRAFAGCSGLTALYFRGDAPGIGTDVFEGANDVTIYYLSGSTGWGATFGGRPAELWLPLPYTYVAEGGTITLTGYTGPGGDLTLPGSIDGMPVVSVSNGAFASCTNVTAVTVPAGVASIGAGAFSGCLSLTNVTISGSVTNIGSNAFADCPSLAAIVVDALNPVYSSLGGVLLNASRTLLLQYPAGKTGSYAVPDTVESIGDLAFAGCAGLTAIMLPNSATNIGAYAFLGCTGLTDFAVESLNPAYASTDGLLFDKSQTTLVQCPGGRTGTVVIAAGITVIRDGAFISCGKLDAIEVDASNPAYSSLEGVLFDKSKASLIRLPGAIAGSYSVPNGVTHLASGAFSSCTGLVTVTIPLSVTNLGDYVFAGCGNLAGVYFKGHAPSLGLGTFVGAGGVMVYYLPGATGWGATFGSRPAVMWNAQVGETAFGVRSNNFGFTIVGSTNLVVVIEACTNLAMPSWLPLQTNILNEGSSYFSDPDSSAHRARFYQLRWP